MAPKTILLVTKWSFMWYKNAGTTSFCFVTNHAFDGRTDRIFIASPRLHSMQRGEKSFGLFFLRHSVEIRRAVT